MTPSGVVLFVKPQIGSPADGWGLSADPPWNRRTAAEAVIAARTYCALRNRKAVLLRMASAIGVSDHTPCQPGYPQEEKPLAQTFT
jgi:hypothetical protein